MSGELSIRLARPSDAAAVMTLQRRLFPDDPNALTEPDFFDGAISRTVQVISAHKGNALAGFVALRNRAWRPWTGMDFVGVAEEARGMGIGDALLDAATAACPRPVLRLFVRPSNTRAVALYVRHRFTRTGRRTGNYPDGEDALVMMRWTGLRRKTKNRADPTQFA